MVRCLLRLRRSSLRRARSLALVAAVAPWVASLTLFSAGAGAADAPAAAPPAATSAPATSAPATAPVANALRENDFVAVCGDSITEQKMYSLYIEDYLLMCRPKSN